MVSKYIGFTHYIVDQLQRTNSPTEVIENINEIINDIKKYPKECIENLEEIRKNFAEENGCCEHCGNEMYYKSWNESRGECRGFPVNEPLGEMYCDNCGHTY